MLMSPEIRENHTDVLQYFFSLLWRTGALLRYLPRARCLFSALSRVHSRCSFSYRRSSDLIYDHLNLIVPVLYSLTPPLYTLSQFSVSRLSSQRSYLLFHDSYRALISLPRSDLTSRTPGTPISSPERSSSPKLGCTTSMSSR
jgi:hypothetical protein